ncbi:hypothetical protein Rs2_31665 [Raphanus sativus]|uniref:Uncharacterized protein LOC108806067 n=1 Tax=Raphanus sativus TaxID=3726 RepID=A0A6J0JDB0_RAPSA|nr:uncharacterized protein LOC108806067 [Raphanus sativus]KAJ4891917.1 hypothetical protein Rs2_31665 [Raphanus sativus]
MTSFAAISNFVIQCHERAGAEEHLESYFQGLSQDVCNKWNFHNASLTEFLSTWRERRQDIVPTPVDQPEDLESSWAISLSTAQSALVKLENSDRALLTTKMLLEGVPIHYQSETCAVDRLEDVRSFMVEGNYVRQMVVHHRPRGNDEDDQNKFESLIEYLLVRGPVVASFDVFPSYDEEFTLNMGQGIFKPTPDEHHMRAYQTFPRHCIVLFGKGVQVQGSDIQEFWEGLESRGEEFGDEGFVRLARHHCVIREVVELKV